MAAAVAAQRQAAAALQPASRQGLPARRGVKHNKESTRPRQGGLVQQGLVGAAPHKVAAQRAVLQLAGQHARQRSVKQRARLRGWVGSLCCDC